MPESVWTKPLLRETWLHALWYAHTAYQEAIEADVSYQDARFILPEGTTNFIMLEYPVREFLNVYAYRACSMFQWEISDVIRKCRAVLVEKHPWIAPYVKISCQDRPCPDCLGALIVGNGVRCDTCKGTGMVGSKCTFQGWENVEEQCDFSWAKEENRTFQPRWHRIERKGASA